MQCEGEFTVAKFTIPEPDAEFEGRKVFIGGVSSAWNLALVRRGLGELFGDIVTFEQRPLRPGSKTGSAVAVFAELASATAALATRLVNLEGLLGAGTESAVRRVEILPFRSIGTGRAQGGAVVLLAGSARIEARVDRTVATAFARQLAKSPAALAWHPLAVQRRPGGSAAASGPRAKAGAATSAAGERGAGVQGGGGTGKADSGKQEEARVDERAGQEKEEEEEEEEEGASAAGVPVGTVRSSARTSSDRQLCELAIGTVARCVIEEQIEATRGGLAPAAPLLAAAPSREEVGSLRPGDRPRLCPGAAGPPSPDVVRLLSFAGTGRVWRVLDMQLLRPERGQRPAFGLGTASSPDGNSDDHDDGPRWWYGGGGW